ncbi:hypothetical protein DFH09DRAFT_1099813 [Mycena vulgaris]|nr:hypothetical protein DFH09DRAFT_1099813 [Mycena vulgaris]
MKTILLTTLYGKHRERATRAYTRSPAAGAGAGYLTAGAARETCSPPARKRAHGEGEVEKTERVDAGRRGKGSRKQSRKKRNASGKESRSRIEKTTKKKTRLVRAQAASTFQVEPPYDKPAAPRVHRHHHHLHHTAIRACGSSSPGSARAATAPLFLDTNVLILDKPTARAPLIGIGIEHNTAPLAADILRPHRHLANGHPADICPRVSIPTRTTGRDTSKWRHPPWPSAPRHASTHAAPSAHPHAAHSHPRRRQNDVDADTRARTHLKRLQSRGEKREAGTKKERMKRKEGDEEGGRHVRKRDSDRGTLDWRHHIDPTIRKGNPDPLVTPLVTGR